MLNYLSRRSFLHWIVFSIFFIFIRDESSSYFVCLCLIPFIVWPHFKLKLLSILTPAAWVLTDYLRWQSIDNALSVNGSFGIFAENISYRILACGLVVILSMVMLFILNRSNLFRKYPVILFTFVYIFILILAPYPLANYAQNPLYAYFYWACVFIFTQMTWAFILIIEESKKRDVFCSLRILRMQPFWGNGELAQVPAGESMFNQYDMKNDSLVSRLSSIKLMVVIFAYKILSIIYHKYTAQVPSIFLNSDMMLSFWSSVIGTSTAFSQNTQLPPIATFGNLLLRWGVFLSQHLFYLIDRFLIGFGVMVAAAKFVGFNLPQAVYRPFQARTFYEFWARWMTYYVSLVSRFGIEPIFVNLKFIKIQSFRLALSGFLGVFFVGLLSHHYFWYVYALPSRGLFLTIKDYLNVVPYLLAVAFFISLSMTLERKYLKKYTGFMQQSVRVCSYIMLWGLIRSILLSYMEAGSLERFFIILRNLGL